MEIQNGEEVTKLSDAIYTALPLANDLLGIVRDALESHEGLKGVRNA